MNEAEGRSPLEVTGSLLFRLGGMIWKKLAGYVEHIIYRNADNGYTVLNLVSGGGGDYLRRNLLGNR